MSDRPACAAGQAVVLEEERTKKSTRKLAIGRETLRVLAQLDLVRVVGGNPDAQQAGTAVLRPDARLVMPPYCRLSGRSTRSATGMPKGDVRGLCRDLARDVTAMRALDRV